MAATGKEADMEVAVPVLTAVLLLVVTMVAARVLDMEVAVPVLMVVLLLVVTMVLMEG